MREYPCYTILVSSQNSLHYVATVNRFLYSWNNFHFNLNDGFRFTVNEFDKNGKMFSNYGNTLDKSKND